MGYIDKTLTEGETIISSSIFHWWFLARYPIYCLLVVIFGYYITSISDDGGDFYGYALIIFSPIITLLFLLFAWIAKKTTEQVLTNKRVFLKTGLIRRDTDELKKEKVETISIKQSIVGRILNFGDVEFTGTGGINIKFTYVKDPTYVKRQYEQ